VAKVKLLPQNDESRRLDRYELIGEIASGGMATVYLARLGGVGGFQRFVAIKRLHPHLAGEPEFVEMFLDEARLAAGIHHPNVVPILEVGTSERGYYLVMEYIEGDTLARVVARALSKHEGAVVPRPILMRVLLDALAGLAAAHDLMDARGQPVGLVHRDVSPQNILVGIDGSSRLTDFGVARATARLASTRTGKLKGKLAYMAPEQTKPVPTDRRADLFSMGVILWEVLTGRRLFKSDSEAVTLSRLLIEPIPNAREIDPRVPLSLDDVAAHALQRNPADRFQTATEMADALERAAREAEDGKDAGVARPRDVAEYVQRIIGQEIAEQRESVRAWTSLTEPSQVVLGKHGQHAAEARFDTVEAEPDLDQRPDITGRIPLHVVDRARREPLEGQAAGGPLGVPAPPASSRTLPGMMAIPATPTVPHSPALVLAAQAARAVSDDDGELTRVRAASQSVSTPAMTMPQAYGAEPMYDGAGAPLDDPPISAPPMRGSRAPLVVAIAAALGIGGFFLLRGTGAGDAEGQAGPASPPGEATSVTVAAPPAAALPAAAATATASGSADATPAAPASAEPTAVPVAAATPAKAAPRLGGKAVAPPPKASPPPKAPPPKAPPAPKTAEPAPPKPPEASPPDELANPYR
jgi:serine/threonine-protein kinase